MFTKEIHDLTLTSDAADRLFSDVNASGAPDGSFLATMRVLLRKRLPESEAVKLSVVPLFLYRSELDSWSVNANMNSFIPEAIKYPSTTTGHRVFIVHTVASDAGEKMLEIIKTNAGVGKRHMSDYALQEDLRVFYARKLNALFYHNADDRSTVIFTDRLELKQFHALQMMLPKYLPSLFKTSPLTEQETALLKSLGNKTSTDYERMIEEFAKEIDIRAEIIRTKLAGFETAFERVRLDEIKAEIDKHEIEYQGYLYSLRDVADKIQERKYTLAGLECTIDKHSDDSEIMGYFQCNKNLSLISVNGTVIEFVVHGYADIYDQEAFDKYVQNHKGYLYSQLNPAITKPQMERLYKAIFSEGIYKLRICAAYTADMKNGLKAAKMYMFPPESSSYLPNPHIQHHGCIGSYAMRFQEYMKKRDYVGAIDQAAVSARNLNFYDSTVMMKFARELSCSSKSCIEKQDGTLLTPYEVVLELEGLCHDQ
ncbi:MAG: hypothetical protein FWD48_08820 [Oscillospiraceae bacterium]|nr:hypothetical protein [Oscillospiraceae bacterium]